MSILYYVQQQSDIRRNKNLWVDRCKGLAGPFALALLVAIPYIAENSSGPIIGNLQCKVHTSIIIYYYC